MVIYINKYAHCTIGLVSNFLHKCLRGREPNKQKSFIDCIIVEIRPNIAISLKSWKLVKLHNITFQTYAHRHTNRRSYVKLD